MEVNGQGQGHPEKPPAYDDITNKHDVKAAAAADGDAINGGRQQPEAEVVGEGIELKELAEEVDTSKMSPLTAAVYNNHAQEVRQLLTDASPEEIVAALMLAISLGHDDISEKIIRSPMYAKIKQLNKPTTAAQDGSAETTAPEVKPPPPARSHVTPLMLAAQNNQFNTVRLLLARGETIQEPHLYTCKCEMCSGAPDYDELRHSQTRLTTFRALCSEAYIVYTSTDPILTTFERSQQMMKLALSEKKFREQYTAIANDLKQMSHDLMDCVRNNHEQRVVLESGGGDIELEHDVLDRLILGLHYHHEKFISHWICQELLWNEFFSRRYIHLLQMPSLRMMLHALFYLLLYPVAALWYIVWPRPSWASQFVSTPFIKLLATVSAYFIFLILVVMSSLEEASSSGSKVKDYPVMGEVFSAYLNKSLEGYFPDCRRYETPTPSDELDIYKSALLNGSTPHYAFIGDLWVRPHVVADAASMVFYIWIVGLTINTFRTFMLSRAEFFFNNAYNIIDIVSQALYILALGLRIGIIHKTKQSIEFYSNEEGWEAVDCNASYARMNMYYLDADRTRWSSYDVFYFSEVCLALASVMTICRLTYILAFNTKTGVLVVSLSKMVVDVFWFMFLLIVLIVAFVVGIRNLTWYFSKDKLLVAEIDPDLTEQVYDYFSTTFKTMLFSMFGMTDADALLVKDYGTTMVSVNFMLQFLFASFQWIMLIILLNILIARMSETYSDLSENLQTEWSFFSTMLMLEYMRDDGMLAVPFNLIPSTRHILYVYNVIRQRCCRNTSDDEKDAEKKEKEAQKIQMTQQVMKKLTLRFIHRRTRVADGDENHGEDKTLAAMEKNLDKLRNDMAGLRAHFMKLIKLEVKAEEKLLMECLAKSEARSRSELVTLQTELKRQAAALHDDQVAWKVKAAESLAAMENGRRREMTEIKIAVEQQTEALRAQFDLEQGRVISAVNQMSENDEALAVRVTDTAAKVERLEVVVNQLPKILAGLLSQQR